MSGISEARKSAAVLLRRQMNTRIPGIFQKLTSSRMLGWLVVAGLLLIWQIVAASDPHLAIVLPEIRLIALRWVELLRQGVLPALLGQTLSVMAVGYVVGAAGGIAIGLLMGRSRLGYILLEPLMELLRPVPIPAVVPLLMLFLGIGDMLKEGSVVIAAFFPVAINTFAGVRAIPSTMRETSLTFGLSSWQTMWAIALPSAAPSILVGMRVALAISLIVTVFTEMIAGNSGIGSFILSSQQTLTILDLYVGVFTLAICGYLLNLAFLSIERRLIPWHDSARAG